MTVNSYEPCWLRIEPPAAGTVYHWLGEVGGEAKNSYRLEAELCNTFWSRACREGVMVSEAFAQPIRGGGASEPRGG